MFFFYLNLFYLNELSIYVYEPLDDIHVLIFKRHLYSPLSLVRDGQV